MKRVVLLILVVALLAGCHQPAAQAPKKHIKWLTETDSTKSMWLAQKYRQETGIDVEVILTLAPDGTTSEIDAMFASGDAPNVYTAYGGRTCTYYDDAIPLSLDEDKYIPGMLDMCKNSKGQVVAVPFTFWLQSGAIDRDLAAEYGLLDYIPKNEDRAWTIAQFEEMAERFRAQAPADFFVTAIYAASGSGDYWVQLYEKGLGAHPLYGPSGKLDVLPLKGAWSKLKEWETKGWVPNGVQGLSDTVFTSLCTEGRLLFYGSDTNASAVSNAEFVSYPSTDGSFVPFAVAPTCHIALPSGNEATDAMAKAFAEWLGKKEQHQVLFSNWTTRLDVEGDLNYGTLEGAQLEEAKVNVEWAKAMMAKHGVMNMGIGSTAYQCIRSLRAQKMGEFFAGKAIDTTLAEFQNAGEACFQK